MIVICEDLISYNGMMVTCDDMIPYNGMMVAFWRYDCLYQYDGDFVTI